MDRLGHLSEAAKGMAADSVKVYLVRLAAGGLEHQKAHVVVVQAEGNVDVIIICKEILHSAKTAHSLFPGGSHKYDISGSLDPCFIEGTDQAQEHSQRSCIVTDPGSIQKAVLFLHAFHSPKGEYGIHMALDQHLRPLSCSAADADHIAAPVCVDVLQPQRLEFLSEYLGAVFLMAGGSLDEHQLLLLLNGLRLIGLDEGQRFLYADKPQHLFKLGSGMI